jgi:hypothetical protein
MSRTNRRNGKQYDQGHWIRTSAGDDQDMPRVHTKRKYDPKVLRRNIFIGRTYRIT